MEQRVMIRITMPSIELQEAVELKEKIDELVERFARASVEMSVMTAPKVPEKREV